jgi:membrane protein YdbS with pleckstrin-like domain
MAAPDPGTRFRPTSNASAPAPLPFPFAGEAGWRRVDPRLGTIRQLEVAAIAVFALVIGAAVSAVTGQLVVLVIALVGAGLAWILASRYMARRVRSWRYLEREQELLVSRGVMFQHLSLVPYGRMQTIEVTAGPVERSFHLATVRLHTASAATDARIPGLSVAEAARLRDRLALLGEASGEGL